MLRISLVRLLPCVESNAPVGGTSSDKTLGEGGRVAQLDKDYIQLEYNQAVVSIVSSRSSRTDMNASRRSSRVPRAQDAARISLACAVVPAVSSGMKRTPSTRRRAVHRGTIARPEPMATRLTIVCFS